MLRLWYPQIQQRLRATKESTMPSSLERIIAPIVFLLRTGKEHHCHENHDKYEASALVEVWPMSGDAYVKGFSGKVNVGDFVADLKKDLFPELKKWNVKKVILHKIKNETVIEQRIEVP